MTIETIATLGPAGSWHELAVKQLAPEAKVCFASSFNQVVKLLLKHKVQGVILALRNNLVGEIKEVKKLRTRHNLKLKTTTELKIVHHLWSNDPIKLNQLELVVSHPAALTQCQRFLKTHRLKTQTSSSTTTAALKLLKTTRKLAAIAGPTIGNKLGLTCLAEDIGDGPSLTEFGLFYL